MNKISRNTFSRFFSTPALIGLFMGVMAPNANAVPISGYSFSGGFETTASATSGFYFSTNQQIEVTSLGIVDSKMDGLNFAHDVGIWDMNGNLLSSTTVAAGNVAPLIDGFRYSSISSLILTANETYIVGAQFILGNGDNMFQGITRTASTAITFTDSATYSTAGTALAFPTYQSFPITASANLLYETGGSTAVPEPATLALFGVGLIGFPLSRRKSKV